MKCEDRGPWGKGAPSFYGFPFSSRPEFGDKLHSSSCLADTLCGAWNSSILLNNVRSAHFISYRPEIEPNHGEGLHHQCSVEEKHPFEHSL